MNNFRDDFWDFARGVGMILVVLGHTIFFGTNFIYLFHIPLFFIISGALFKPTQFIRNAVVKKFKRLYLPNLKYGLFFLVLHNLFVKIGFYSPMDVYSIGEFFKGFIKVLCWGNEELGGAMWFLRSLFVSYCLFIVYDKVINFNNPKIAILVSAIFIGSMSIVGWIISTIPLLYPVRTLVTIPFIVFPFIMFGQLYRLHDMMRGYINKHSIVIFLVSTLLLILGAMHINIDLAHLRLPNFLVYYGLGIIGFCMIVALFSIMKVICISRWIIYVGRHSISVLALHFFCFKLVTMIYLRVVGGDATLLYRLSPQLQENILLPFVYLLVGILLPLAFNRILQSISIFFHNNQKQLI